MSFKINKLKKYKNGLIFAVISLVSRQKATARPAPLALSLPVGSGIVGFQA
jgi:hypothetical protein